MNKKEPPVYIRAHVLAQACNIHQDAISRLIYEKRIMPDAFVEWGVDVHTGQTKTRPMFLRSKMVELVDTVKRYVRGVSQLRRITVRIDGEIDGDGQ